ncbi:uncharacterized protein METZ01_LOCUS239133 [marine metagenome]|uniref:Uncharacterized protein n=1 Tax=marine metagenome TaxID=408172 RepID=A0A382HGF7_9ZZZZ
MKDDKCVLAFLIVEKKNIMPEIV